MAYVLIFIFGTASGATTGSAEFNTKTKCEQANADIRTAGHSVWAKCYEKGALGDK